MNRLRPAMRRILPLPVVYCLLSVANCQFSIAQSPPPSFDSLFRRASSFNANWDTVRVYPHLEAGVMGVAGELPPLDTMVFHPPAVGRVLSGYGRRGGRSHHGTDIKVDLGQPIYAAWDGIVRLSRWNRAGFGNLVVVRHANGVETYYAHLSARSVRANEIVEAGQEIGLGGRTGRASGLHLHFEMRYRDHSYDPERYIDFVSGTLRGARPVSPRDELTLRREPRR